jgi:hypothetical protein
LAAVFRRWPRGRLLRATAKGGWDLRPGSDETVQVAVEHRREARARLARFPSEQAYLLTRQENVTDQRPLVAHTVAQTVNA